MGDTLLCSAGEPLAFRWTSTPRAFEKCSSTASTAVCLEQVVTEEPDPRPNTEDWQNLITSFDPSRYTAFSMSAYVTAATVDGNGSDLADCVFRTVERIDYFAGYGGSAVIPVDGVVSVPWTICSTGTSQTPDMVEVADITVGRPYTASLYIGGDYWTASPTRISGSAWSWDPEISNYTATATLSARKVRGGSASAIRSLSSQISPAWVGDCTGRGTVPIGTRTVTASASASGAISSIAGTGSYPGGLSAAVGLANIVYGMDPSGYGSSARLRDAWAAGKLWETPYGCGLSGIIELSGEGDPGDSPILSTATGG